MNSQILNLPIEPQEQHQPIHSIPVDTYIKHNLKGSMPPRIDHMELLAWM